MNKKKYRKQNAKNPSKYQNRVSISNARTTSSSGASGCGDRTANTLPSIVNFSPFDQDQLFSNMYYSDWQARKIIDIPVDDMLREGWEYNGLNEEDTRCLLKKQSELNVINKFKDAMRLERLLGGACIFMGVADQPANEQDASKPIDFNNVQEGDLKYLNVIPRTRVNKIEIDNDVLSPNYGHPHIYYVNGQAVHRSRLLIFDADPLLPVADPTVTRFNLNRNDGFGVSVLLPIYDDLMRATGSRQAAFHLINLASVMIMSGDFQSLLETKRGNDMAGHLQGILDQVSIYRAAMLPKTPGSTFELGQLSSSFGSVPELLMSFLQVLSAASDIPATRFIGQAPGGLNATGESDLENYYNMIAAKQEHRLKPQVHKFLQLIGRSTFGRDFNDDNLIIDFPKLWNMSELEESQVNTNETNAIVSMVQNGIISSEEAVEQLKSKGILDEMKLESFADSDISEDDDSSNLKEALKFLKKAPTDSDVPAS